MIAKLEPNPLPAPAAPPEPGPAEIEHTLQKDFIEILLDTSGLRSTLVNYIQTTRLVSFLDKNRLAEIDVAALERVLTNQFRPGAFYAAISGQLRKNYNPERLPALSEWLRSPVTNKLAALESQAFAPGARDELVAFANGLKVEPPAEARLLLIHRLYDSLKTCDMEVETTLALVHTVAQSISPALPSEKRYSAAELDRALGAVKSRYRAVMKNARIVHYLFAYQSVSDEELEQYVNFVESDDGRWLISVVDKAFLEATESISRGLVTDIVRKVKPRRRLPSENTAKDLLP